jgi:hypothetical protein
VASIRNGRRADVCADLDVPVMPGSPLLPKGGPRKVLYWQWVYDETHFIYQPQRLQLYLATVTVTRGHTREG